MILKKVDYGVQSVGNCLNRWKKNFFQFQFHFLLAWKFLIEERSINSNKNKSIFEYSLPLTL